MTPPLIVGISGDRNIRRARRPEKIICPYKLNAVRTAPSLVSQPLNSDFTGFIRLFPPLQYLVAPLRLANDAARGVH
jgi:hypothetical protein